MTQKLTKVVHDIETGKTEEVELTPFEIAELDQAQAQFAVMQAQRKADEEATAIAKTSASKKLAELGLTAEEIAALTK
jgi:hypothetical protein